MTEPTHTPLPVVANVSRIITKVIDRITGDRMEYPLLVCTAVVHALKQFGIEARVMYGQAAWIEVLEDHSLIWAGCWGEHFNFWVATQYGEVVDLNTSVAHRKRSHQTPQIKSMLSPPMLWSAMVPRFYRYEPEGIAEIELTDPEDQKRCDLVLSEISEKCRPELLNDYADSFPNESILCPNKKVLDDTHESFKKFDRALGVRGMPEPPF